MINVKDKDKGKKKEDKLTSDEQKNQANAIRMYQDFLAQQQDTLATKKKKLKGGGRIRDAFVEQYD